MRRSWCGDRARTARALATLAWRGPDGQRLIEVGDWFLGVARLWITDRGAEQPIVCPSTGRAVAFNGAATSAEREWREHGAGRTRNDAELALRRLAAEGPQALTATCGPHALAIVDPRDDTLYLARDPEGEKPLLVVTAGRDVVALASSASALRALGLDVRVSDAEAARLLRFGFALGPTLCADGMALHHDLRGAFVARGGAGLTRVDSRPPIEAVSDAPLDARVVAATARCAAAEVPVGLCLSGGVDSSCLAAALHRLGRAVPGYQFCARGESRDERMRAASVAAHTGLELRPLDAGPEVLDALFDLSRCTGMPQGDPSVLAAHALARAARADGVKVLLSGEGADDQWLGYRRHRAARWLPRRGLRALPVPGLAMSNAARLARAFAAPSPYDALLEVAPPAFRGAALAAEMQAAELPGAGGRSALARAREVDRAFYLRHDLLPKLDTALMAAGVEGRAPYLDPAVLASPETTAGEPRAILGKRALRRAFAGDLPPGITAKKKVGFGLPLDRWLRDDDRLADLLCERRTLSRPHVNSAGLLGMLDLHRRGRARLGHALYLLAAFEAYLRVLEEQEAAA